MYFRGRVGMCRGCFWAWQETDPSVQLPVCGEAEAPAERPPDSGSAPAPALPKQAGTKG